MKTSTQVGNTEVDAFTQYLRAKGRLPTTIESYKRDAVRFLDYLATNRIVPTRVEPDHLVAYQQYLIQECKERENTVRRAVIGVRQFFRFLTETQVLQSTPFDEVPIPERQEIYPDIERKNLGRLIDVALSEPSDLIEARNAAILCLIGIEGLKATEVIALEWADMLLNESSSSLLVRGGRARTIALDGRTVTVLARYKEFYRDLGDRLNLEKSKRRKVFVAFKGRDASVFLPSMTRHGLKFIIYEIGSKFELKHLNTEILRHFAINQLIAAGKGPEGILEHLGLRRLGNVAKHFSATRQTAEVLS